MVEEDGGFPLFDFVVKVHQLIEIGKLEITEWHRIAKIIFKQMIEVIEFIHSKHVAHFDISLENFLINDVDVVLVTVPNKGTQTIKFSVDDESSGIQIKLCDFGLAELFHNKSLDESKWLTNKYCGKVCVYVCFILI